MALSSSIDPSLNFESAYAKREALFSPLGFSPPAEATRQSLSFLHELKDWNKKINLTADSSDEEWLLNHLLDSLMPLKTKALENLSSAARAIDVGTGGGFPGVPLAFARPSWTMVLLDSVQKKMSALENILAKLGVLDRIHPIADRSEELARDIKQRETYDLAFCRAVGPLSTVLELTLPLLKPGGSCFLHRGVEIEQDVKSAARALPLLGGQVMDQLPYQLPHRDKPHYILQVKKVSATPPEYPRRPGMPGKKPL